MAYKKAYVYEMDREDWIELSHRLGGDLSGDELAEEIGQYCYKMATYNIPDKYWLFLRLAKQMPIFINTEKLARVAFPNFKVGRTGKLLIYYINALESLLIACGHSATVLSNDEYPAFLMFMNGLASDMKDMYHKVANSDSKQYFEDGVYLRAKKDFIIGMYIMNLRKRMELRHLIWHDVPVPHLLSTADSFNRTLLRNKAIITSCEGRRQFKYALDVMGVDKVMTPEYSAMDLNLSNVKRVDSTLQHDGYINVARKEATTAIQRIVNEL